MSHIMLSTLDAFSHLVLTTTRGSRYSDNYPPFSDKETEVS